MMYVIGLFAFAIATLAFLLFQTMEDVRVIAITVHDLLKDQQKGKVDALYGRKTDNDY